MGRGPGCSWLLLAPPGSSWLLLAPPGSSWLLLAPPGSSWLLLAPCLWRQRSLLILQRAPLEVGLRGSYHCKFGCWRSHHYQQAPKA